MKNSKCYVKSFGRKSLAKNNRIMKEVERVMRKLMVVLVVLAFACGTMLMMSSCAKKQIGTGEAAPAAAPSAPAAAAAPVQQAWIRLRTSGRSRPRASTSTLTGRDQADAKAILEKKAAWLRANPSYNVKIEGNCDERGTNEYNLALGDRRAKAAQKFLNALGIGMNRMSTISYGEEKPACTEKNEQCWSKNRRDDFKLSK